MIEWISNNVNWIFDGIGVSVGFAVFGLLFKRFKKKSNQSDILYPLTSYRTSIVGDNSFNFQGDNITISNSILNTFPKHREADLFLVDIATYDSKKNVILDIKVRNISDEVVFLKRAEFKTINKWFINYPVHPSAMPPSYNYDVRISRSVGKTIKYNISQCIKPNEVDRFTFTVGNIEDGGRAIGMYLYEIELKLIYNEDNRSLLSPRIIVEVPPDMLILGLHTHQISSKHLEYNRKIAKDLLSNIDDKVIINPEIVEVVHSWAEAEFRKNGSEDEGKIILLNVR